MAWNTDGSKHLMPGFIAKRGHHFPLAKLSVPATLWLNSAQMQLLCGTLKQMEAQPLTVWPSSLPSLCAGLSLTADAGPREFLKLSDTSKGNTCSGELDMLFCSCAVPATLKLAGFLLL